MVKESPLFSWLEDVLLLVRWHQFPQLTTCLTTSDHESHLSVLEFSDNFSPCEYFTPIVVYIGGPVVCFEENLGFAHIQTSQIKMVILTSNTINIFFFTLTSMNQPSPRQIALSPFVRRFVV